jgi:hypothetical protein
MKLLIMQDLLPGDVLGYVGQATISHAIQKIEGHYLSHISTHVGSGKVIEMLNNGAEWNTVSDSIADAKSVLVFRMIQSPRPTEAALMKIIKDNKLDKVKYNWLGLGSQLFFIKTGLYTGCTKWRLVCSQHAGKLANLWDRSLCKRWWTLSPEDWAKSAQYTCVGFLKCWDGKKN